MEWFATDWPTTVRIVLSAAGIFISVILFIRLNGLRTLSKMSSFDFVVTIAIGSMVAGTIMSETPSLMEGALAIAALVGCQRVVAHLRSRAELSALVDNSPVLLMDREHYQREAMKRARVTEDDLAGKLREANVTQLSQVLAVVLESTGDISVLHSTSERDLDDRVMRGVRGYVGD